MATIDTIYALATPPGRSGIAVVRLSGPDSKAICKEIAGAVKTPRKAYYKILRDKNGQEIDQALVLYFQAPASFTGEDVVEFQVHGGRAIISAVLKRLSEFSKARPALPGEFTRRALENGKLDMLQVEALGDFINAETEVQRQNSYRNLSGSAGEWVEKLRDALVEAMSLVTASIDFSDEDLPDSLVKSIGDAIENSCESLKRERAKTVQTQALRDGYRVAILGKPNVGKSSLINKLSGKDVAIATDVAGTTRDVLEVFMDIGGLPVLVYDTAGLRETDDKVEAIGVERAREAARDADLRIFLFEKTSDLDEIGLQPSAHDLVLQSKSDLYGAGKSSVSAMTGQGIDDILAYISEYFANTQREFGFFSGDRQVQSLNNAIFALDDALEFYQKGEIVYEMLAESLRQSVFALDLLIGRVDVEDMLDVIFSKFCIGK